MKILQDLTYVQNKKKSQIPETGPWLPAQVRVQVVKCVKRLERPKLPVIKLDNPRDAMCSIATAVNLVFPI